MEAQQQQEEFNATFIEQPAILDKHKAAAVVADAALLKAIAACVDGADVATVCGQIDTFIDEELHKTFSNKKSKKLERGIAFPCCLSVNEVAGHFSPCAEDSIKLKNGDVVKIDLGAHIDGFAALVAHTVVVGGKAEGKAAEVVLAAFNAFQAAARSIRVGALNQEVTAKIQAVCEEFGVEPLQGVLSQRLKKHLIDGNECIINKETPEQRVEDWQFAPGDVLALDVYVTSGDGMGRQADLRTTVYKREMEVQYSLKSTRARAFFAVVNQKYPTLPFSIRGFEDLVGAKLGVKECLEHDLLMPYPVLTDKPGEIIAQFKGTIVVQKNNSVMICGGHDLAGKEGLVTEKKIKNEELAKLIAGGMWQVVKEKKQ